MGFEKVASVSEIPEGGMKQITVNEMNIVVIRLNGNVFALQDEGSHMKASLNEGYLDENEICCALHGARFDIRTGEVTSAMPPCQAIRKYNIKIEGNDILVEV